MRVKLESPGPPSIRPGSASIPVIIGIDVEPDPIHLDPSRPDPWQGYELAHEYFARLRRELENRSSGPVNFSWYFRMDPQIARVYGTPEWAAQCYAPLIEEVLREGDEIGLHPHLHRWLETRQDWLLDFQDAAWHRECIDCSLESFARAFGKPCTSMRFSAWMNQAAVEQMDRSGVRFDLSLIPCQRPTWNFEAGGIQSGPLASYLGMPRAPYRPSRRNFRRPGVRNPLKITMIPLTVAPVARGFRLRRLVRDGKDLIRSGLRCWGRFGLVSMMLPETGPHSFAVRLNKVLENSKKPYLLFALRSDFPTDPLRFAKVTHGIETLIHHPARDRFVFATPAQAVSILKGT